MKALIAGLGQPIGGASKLPHDSRGLRTPATSRAPCPSWEGTGTGPKGRAQAFGMRCLGRSFIRQPALSLVPAEYRRTELW